MCEIIKENYMLLNITDNRYKTIEKSMKSLGYEKSSLIEVLHKTQEIFGYLDKDVMKFIAKRLKLPLSKVYGVSTFYNFFRLKPRGEHTAIICTGTACYIKGAQKIIEVFEKKFEVTINETTNDGFLSILTARCIGSCSLAPLIVIDNKSMGNVTLGDVNTEIEELTQ